MYAVPAEPGALVEAVARGARRDELTDASEDRALRGSALERQTQQDGLVDVKGSEAHDERCRAYVELPASGFRGHDDTRAFRGPEPRREWAPVDRIESQRSPAPSADQQHCPDDESTISGKSSDRCDAEHRTPEERRGSPREIRQREPEREPRARSVSRVALQPAHGATQPFSCASFAGPMPGTASSSS